MSRLERPAGGASGVLPPVRAPWAGRAGRLHSYWGFPGYPAFNPMIPGTTENLIMTPPVDYLMPIAPARRGGNPNAYYNVMRRSRNRTPSDEDYRRIARGAPPVRRAARRQEVASAAPPVPELGTFFHPNGTITWPSYAPTTGDLGTRRAAAERAIQTVWTEWKTGRPANKQHVADAKAKLTAYGNPALQDLQDKGDRQAVLSFYDYLIELYRSTDKAGRT